MWIILITILQYYIDSVIDYIENYIRREFHTNNPVISYNVNSLWKNIELKAQSKSGA